MTDNNNNIDSVPSVESWRPPAPLTVVLSESESNELARKLADDGGWWYFQDRVSVNGIAMELSAEKEWDEGEDRGTAWVSLRFPGYNLAGDLPRKKARHVAAGLAGESAVSVPVMLNCEPWDQAWLPDPVAVYFSNEHNYRLGIVQ